MDQPVSLQVTDYIVLAFILLVSLGIGVLFAVTDFRNVNRVEYLLGGRRMFMLPVALSIYATFTSGISLLGSPAEFYLYGEMPSVYSIGISFGYLLAMLVIVPMMYPLRLTSLYTYLQLRFESASVRMLAVAVGMLQTLCYMAVAVLSSALALQATAELPLWLSVGIVGLIGAVYTAIGGIKSVVWTDAFQTVVMLVGLLTIIVKGYSIVGGGKAVLKIVKESGRFAFNDISFDPRATFTWWSATFGVCVWWLSTICNQSSLQRISSMKSLAAAKGAFLFNSVFNIIHGSIMIAISMMTYAYFVHIGCDPFQAGQIKSANQLSPYFVMHALSDVPAIGGVYLSMIFSGSLSTFSSGINALAANTVEDILSKPLQKVEESTATVITKVLVFLYGILIIGLAYGANSLQGSVSQMLIASTGSLGGPILGIFILGALFPWTNKYGAFCGGVTALLVNVWLAIGSEINGRKYKSLSLPPVDMCFVNSTVRSYTSNTSSNAVSYATAIFTKAVTINPTLSQPSHSGFFLYEISFEWYSIIGVCVCLSLGTAVSYFTRSYSKSIAEERYLFPFVRRFWFPDTLHRKCQDPEDEAKSML
ncbi:hypothetical protein BsWGS_11608 [Bradybaena similaris]